MNSNARLLHTAHVLFTIHSCEQTTRSTPVIAKCTLALCTAHQVQIIYIYSFIFIYMISDSKVVLCRDGSGCLIYNGKSR